MKSMDEENVAKKFRGVSATQDNIQSLSLWVLHHKAHHEKIVDTWFKVLKKSKMPHRLTLFYLCNDIVQNSKRKHAMCFKDQFKDVLKDATLLVRDDSIRAKVERLYTIWDERSVYEKDYTDELKSILNDTKVRATMSSKLLAEFQPKALCEMVKKVKKFEEEVSQKSTQIANLRIEPSEVETIKKLKDKKQGLAVLRQYDVTKEKLEDFIKVVKQEIDDQSALVELLEQSELFYDAQHGEAKIVANAYKNFGVRMNNQKKRLHEHASSLSAPLSPPVSPSAALDAPSPGNTPPQAMGNDDIEAVDMDLSDDEQDQQKAEKKRGNNTGVTSAYLQPIASVTQIHMQSSKGVPRRAPVSPPMDEQPSPEIPQGSPMTPESSSVTSENKTDSFLPPTYPSESAKSAAKFLSNLISQIDSDRTKSQNDSWSSGGGASSSKGPSEPSKDDGGGTPVMDEMIEAAPEKTEKKTNAIDFLTQLIKQTKTKEPSPPERPQEPGQWEPNVMMDAPRPPPPLMSLDPRPLMRPPQSNGQPPYPGNFNLPPPPRPPNLSPRAVVIPGHRPEAPRAPGWMQRPPFPPPSNERPLNNVAPQPPFDPKAPRPLFDSNVSRPPRPQFDHNPPRPSFDSGALNPPRPPFDASALNPPRPSFDPSGLNPPRPPFDGNSPQRPAFDPSGLNPPRPLFDGNSPQRPPFDANSPQRPRFPQPPAMPVPPRPPFSESFPPGPPSRPPGPPLPKPPFESPTSAPKPPFAPSETNKPNTPAKEKDALAEEQEEFIQKLKRKSSLSENEPPKKERLIEEIEEPVEPEPEKPRSSSSSAISSHHDPRGDPRSDSRGDPRSDPRSDPRRRSSDDKTDEHRNSSYERGPPAPWTGRGPPPPPGYLSERDRWAYEMAKQQFFKDMYDNNRPPPRGGRRPVPSHDNRHYARH